MTCPAHDYIEREIAGIKHISNLRDEEQEKAISGLVLKMDRNNEKLEHLEKRMDGFERELPGNVAREVTKHIDLSIAKVVRSMLKWLVVVIVGTGLSVIITIVVKNLIGG